ncbi:MAG: hypothetical protein BAJALOKI3v1_110003 [Promethearchaeota archaeon]|nr:MAG: hypothetical protein BAJALOKI3v1_110003 [Candidatus Lokiarchaeota archaeon]
MDDGISITHNDGSRTFSLTTYMRLDTSLSAHFSDSLKYLNQNQYKNKFFIRYIINLNNSILD